VILNSHIEFIAGGELTLAGGGVSSAQGNPQTVSWQQDPSTENSVLVSSPLIICAH
jgi:hypothetical protein